MWYTKRVQNREKKTDSTYYYIYFLSIEEKKVMTFKHDNFMNFINPKQNWFSANEHFYTQEKSNNQLPRKRANQQMIVISIYVFLFLFLLSLYVCLCVNLLSFCKWHLFSWNEQPSERAISDVNCPFKLLQLFVGLGEKKSGNASWKDFFLKRNREFIHKNDIALNKLNKKKTKKNWTK